MKVAILPVTPLQQNSTLLWCTATMKAAVIDPGGDLDRIKALVAKAGVTVEKLLITHGHIDHCGGAAQLARELGVPIEGPHKEDLFWINRLAESSGRWGIPAEIFTPDRWLVQGDKVRVGDLEIDVLHCPGHTPGHVVFFHEPSRLAVVGDFQRDQALELVNRYFGDLPPGPPLPRMGRRDSPLAGRVELEMRDSVTLPRTYIAWPTPPEGDIDDAPLEIYQAIMSDGLTSRLHKSLVYEKQIAQSASVRYHPGEIAGQFVVQVTAAEGHDLDEMEASVDAEISRLATEPPTDEEINRVKNRIESSHYRQLTRIGGFGGLHVRAQADAQRLDALADAFV